MIRKILGLTVTFFLLLAADLLLMHFSMEHSVIRHLMHDIDKYSVLALFAAFFLLLCCTIYISAVIEEYKFQSLLSRIEESSGLDVDLCYINGSFYDNDRIKLGEYEQLLNALTIQKDGDQVNLYLNNYTEMLVFKPKSRYICFKKSDEISYLPLNFFISVDDDKLIFIDDQGNQFLEANFKDGSLKNMLDLTKCDGSVPLKSNQFIIDLKNKTSKPEGVVDVEFFDNKFSVTIESKLGSNTQVHSFSYYTNSETYIGTVADTIVQKKETVPHNIRLAGNTAN